MTTAAIFGEIRIADIVPDPRQPRKHFDPAALEQLAASIKEQGIVEPLIVRPIKKDPNNLGQPHPKGAQYVLVAGERRWRAAQLKTAGPLVTVPAIVREYATDQAHAAQLVENLDREALRPLEIAEAYHRWLQPSLNPVTHVDAAGTVTIKPQYKRTQAELAKALGKTEAHVSQLLALRELPAPARQLLDSGVLSFAHARALLPLTRYPSALSATVRLIVERERWGAVFTVRELQSRVATELTRVKERERRAAARKQAKKGKGKGTPVESDRVRWAREDAERREANERRAREWKAGVKAVAPQLARQFDRDRVHGLVRKIPAAVLRPLARALHLPNWGDDSDVVRVLRPRTPARRLAAWLWLQSRLERARQSVRKAGAAAERQAAKSVARARKGGRK